MISLCWSLPRTLPSVREARDYTALHTVITALAPLPYLEATMSNMQVVLDFIDAWNRMDWDAVMDAFTDDIVYDNIPMNRLEGKAAVEPFIRNGMELEGVDWEVLSIAENGDKVLTERIDNFLLPGNYKLVMPVMGTFEIDNGKIKAWRDYFDLATFTTQMAEAQGQQSQQQ